MSLVSREIVRERQESGDWCKWIGREGSVVDERRMWRGAALPQAVTLDDIGGSCDRRGRGV